jgi:hypothetical protein
MKILMWIAIVLGVGLAGLLLYASSLSDTFAVSRTQNIKAPAAKVFPLIDDVRAMNTWNPFAKQDPAIKIEYGDATSGPGASYSWTGRQSGAGRLSITGGKANERVDMRLDMTAPMEAHNDIVFSLTPREDNSTDVTWSMTGTRPFLGKLIATVFSMEKMVGGSFEQGLADLKTIAERP